MSLYKRIYEAAAIANALPNVKETRLLGSAVYLPNPNDIDIGVLLKEGVDLDAYIRQLEKDGWETCGDYHGDGPEWNAVQKDGVNLLIMTKEDRLMKFVAAMEICKLFNVQDRDVRIQVCQIVRDGKMAEDFQ